MTRNLYLFVGRSGVGKTTIVDALCRKRNLKAVESYTDRAPRYEGERGHIFVSPAEFDSLPEKVACAAFANYHYCTTTAVLDESDCFVVEPKGVCELLNRYKTRPIVVIGIYARMCSIVERMRKRGDSEDNIKVRLDMDETTFGMMDELCDAVFVNHDLDTTIRDIDHYIAAKEADAEESMFRERFPEGIGERYEGVYLSYTEAKSALDIWAHEYFRGGPKVVIGLRNFDSGHSIELIREFTVHQTIVHKNFVALYEKYGAGYDAEVAWNCLMRCRYVELPNEMSARLLCDSGLLPFVPTKMVPVWGGFLFLKED